MAQLQKYRVWLFVVCVASIAFLAIVWFWITPDPQHPHAYFYAFLFLAVYYWMSVLVTGQANPLRIAMGADGRLSTSKFQFFAWTAVIVFAYVLLFSVLGSDHQSILNEIPPNVLLVMGFSVTTAVGAKGITVSYLSSGQITKPASNQPGGDASLSGLVAKDDSSALDLTKLQMLTWTVIAIFVYLRVVHLAVSNIASASTYPPKFPDIDQSLMVLMGISQGAYLGNKLVTAGSPTLTALSPSGGIPGANVTISGQSLGSAQNGSVILINGQNVSVGIASWADSAVQFTIPLKRPDGSSWNPGEQVSISMIVNGQQTTNLTLAFVPQPIITAVNPPNPPKAAAMTISGRNFGAKQATSKLFLNQIDCTALVTSWTDTQVLFTLQNVLPSGAPWLAGQNIAVQIAVSDDFRTSSYSVATV